MNRFTVFFILVNLFFSSFYLDSWQNANTTSRVLPVLSLVNEGTLQIDSFADKTIDKSYVNGHYYCDKAPLPSFIVTPFYALLKFTGVLKETNNFEEYSKPVFLLGSFICGTLPFLLICALFFLYASKYTQKYNAAMLSMIFLYSSFIFIFSGTFFAHVISSAFLLVSYVSLKYQQNYFYSGLFLGCAFLSEFPIGLIIPVWAVQIYFNEHKFKNVVVFLFGLVPLMVLLMIYNYIIMGSPIDSLYDHLANKGFVEEGKPLGFSFPSLQALWGITISPYRGILIYCPLLILPLVEFLKDKKIMKIKWGTDYLGIIAVCYFLLISSYRMWWGGWSYGPRQLMPIVVLILFEGLIYISKKEINKYLLWPLATIMIVVTWIVKSTVVYSVPTEIKNPFTEYFLNNLFNRSGNPNNILTMLFNVNPWISSLVWIISFIVLISFFYIKRKKVLV